MPPKAAPTFEQLYASFKEKVKDFDNLKGCLDTLGELPDKTLRKLGEINEAIEKLAKDMKRTRPNFAVRRYPDVWDDWQRTFISLVELRKAKESEVRTATDRDEKEEPDHYDVPTVRSDHYEDHTGKADHYETHKGEADHYEATLERTDQTDVDLVLVKEEPATKKAVPAPGAKKAAAKEESSPDEESSGEEEKPAAQPVTKPVAGKEERNSDDSNSDDPKDEKPASEGAKPAAKPSKKEEPPDDNSADGSNDVKKPEAKKAKKPAPGDPMDEEDAVKAIDEAVMHKLDQAKIQVDYQAKPYEHVEKSVKGPELVASQEREQVSVEVAPQEKEERVHSSLCVVASQEREAVDVDSQEREEKQEVDADVDATKLSKTIEVFDDEESHQAEDIQTKTAESFNEDENDVQTEDDEQSNDDHENENDDHSKENDEVNGNKYDQVKIEELFETIAIFLFFPNYKYRKKRWPGEIDL